MNLPKKREKIICEDKKEVALNYIESDKKRWSAFWKTNMPKLTKLIERFLNCIVQPLLCKR